MIESKGMIFAADITNKKRLIEIIKQISPYIDVIKIGNVSLYEHGWRIISDIKDQSDKKIIIDLKLMDIPYIAESISKKALSYGADGIIICGPVGDETISICRNIFADKYIFIFTQFTHMSGLISDEMADEFIDLALSLSCDGIQVPATIPNRISEVKQKVGNDLMIISCGLGKPGPEIGSAIRAGADYEIIGRAIYDPNVTKSSPKNAAMLAKQKITSDINKQNRIKQKEKILELEDS